MLSLKNISKDYVVTKELVVHALLNVSIDFRKNEFVSILGASGCGKTTLLNIVGGLDRYTDGDLKIDGISTADYKENDWNNYRNKRIGFVFQSYNLIPHQTVLENVELALTLSGIDKEERKKRAEKALTDVGLEKELNKRPNQLSGGQMQRVALARALVNNPDILLADEPTGALDSVTSLQVLELLKKVAEDRLVIMVTHNNELAKKFSTRIIKLHDGQVISDSMPFADEQQVAEHASNVQTAEINRLSEQNAKVKTKKHKEKKQRVGMNFITALSLSFKNLMTKKGRTFMTSFAGSIGIIGVALVLALSNGFNIYIAKLQSDTLSGYPITVSAAGADFDAIYDQMQNGFGNALEKFPENDDNIHIYDKNDSGINAMLHLNYIDKNYYEYIDSFYKADLAKNPSARLLNGVQYSYMKTLNVMTEKDGKYVLTDTSTAKGNDTMSMFMGGKSVFQEALGNSDFVKSQYDVLGGHYPASDNEVAVIVDSRNRISLSTLDALGIGYSSSTDGEGKTTYKDIAFAEILAKEFKLIYNDAYFIENNNANPLIGKYYTTLADISGKEEQEAKLAKVAQDTANTYGLKVVGVLRVKEEAPLSIYDAGILYLPSLTEKYVNNSKTSQIAKAQSDGKVYMNAQTDSTSKMVGYYGVPLSMVMQALTKAGYKNVDEDHAMQYVMQQFAASDIPSAIYLYPVDFNSKDEITAFLDGWNKTEQGKLNKIVYTDATAILSNSMGQMVDIISYVLIAFASISLIVSSVMIGIITYVSVIERTKEIGVLRSIGASKNDVSNVFNAESFLIGLAAGLIGVLLTYLLCIPVNAILAAVAGSMLTTNLAVLNPLIALALVAISCLLTLIAGSIPSRFAAKLDPVKALRSE